MNSLRTHDGRTQAHMTKSPAFVNSDSEVLFSMSSQLPYHRLGPGPYIALYALLSFIAQLIFLNPPFFAHPFFFLCRNRGEVSFPIGPSSQSRDFSLTRSALPQHHYSVQYFFSALVNCERSARDTLIT